MRLHISSLCTQLREQADSIIHNLEFRDRRFDLAEDVEDVFDNLVVTTRGRRRTDKKEDKEENTDVWSGRIRLDTNICFLALWKKTKDDVQVQKVDKAIDIFDSILNEVFAAKEEDIR